VGRNSRLKNVLIIAYYWGTRIPGLVKYLPEFGWQPVILTAPLIEEPNTQFRVVETSYRDVFSFWKRLFRLNPDEDVRRQVKKRFGVTFKNSLVDFILTCVGEVVNYPDGDKGWKPFAVTAGSELLQREDIHAILSSSSPITSHLIAKELKIRHKIPWVADFRDLWSQNHNYSYSPIRKLFDRRLELKTLSEADALVTVSEPWAEKLKMLHVGKPVHTISHGYNPAMVNKPPARLTPKFIITYTGSIYARMQNPSKFFVALQDLISDGTMNPDEVEVRFYGSEIDWLETEIKQYGLSAIVKQYEKVSRDISLEKQKESQLLLLLDWDNPREHGVTTAKFFEYLGARRPILATGGVAGNIIDILLDETKAGIHTPTVEDIKSTLKELYQEYKLTGKIAFKGEESKINKYTHREMASKFAELLNHLEAK